MNKAVESVAKAFVRGPSVPEGMLNRVEAAMRCYDPCFSCSTHALGQMPIEIVLIGSDGTVDRPNRQRGVKFEARNSKSETRMEIEF